MAVRAQPASTSSSPVAASKQPAAERSPHADVQPAASGPTSSPAFGCPCGGGCPRCSGRHSAHDAREAEARTLGDRIVAVPSARRPSRAARTHRRGAHSGPHVHARGRRAAPVPAAARATRRPARPAVRSSPRPHGLSGDGDPLAGSERERFEPLLGLDLAGVRVHSGARAESVASEQRAHAFTYGNHVVLGRQAQRASRTHAPGSSPTSSSTSASRRRPPPSNAGSAPGPRTSAADHAHTPRERAPLTVQRLAEDDDSILPAWVSEAASTVADVGAGAVETVSELPGRAADVALDERCRGHRHPRAGPAPLPAHRRRGPAHGAVLLGHRHPARRAVRIGGRDRLHVDDRVDVRRRARARAEGSAADARERVGGAGVVPGAGGRRARQVGRPVRQVDPVDLGLDQRRPHRHLGQPRRPGAQLPRGRRRRHLAGLPGPRDLGVGPRRAAAHRRQIGVGLAASSASTSPGTARRTCAPR